MTEERILLNKPTEAVQWPLKNARTKQVSVVYFVEHCHICAKRFAVVSQQTSFMKSKHKHAFSSPDFSLHILEV